MLEFPCCCKEIFWGALSKRDNGYAEKWAGEICLMRPTSDLSCVAPEGANRNKRLKWEIWKTFLKTGWDTAASWPYLNGVQKGIPALGKQNQMASNIPQYQNPLVAVTYSRILPLRYAIDEAHKQRLDHRSDFAVQYLSFYCMAIYQSGSKRKYRSK